MGDITTGYFANHKLNINDVNSLQNSPETFKPQLTIKEAIIDFVRKLLFLDTKSHALSDLNRHLYENHLAHSPMEILTIFDKLLPDELKNSMSFFIHYENNDKKIKSLEIVCSGKFLKIEPEQCWLTIADKEIIKNSVFNIYEVTDKENNGYSTYENCKAYSEITREAFIKNELIKLIDEWSVANEYDKKSYNAILMTNLYTSEIERFVFRVDGHSRLDISLKGVGHQLIMNARAEYGAQINANASNFKINNHFTLCPYSELTKVMTNIDGKLNTILEGDYLHYDRQERRIYIEPVLTEIKKLELLIQYNNIIRMMGVEITSGEGSTASTSQHLSDMLKNAELLYHNEIDIAFDRQQASLISNDLDAIKRNIITKKHASDNPEERIKYIDLIVNGLRAKESDFVGEEVKIESERIQKEIRNINILHEYCEKIIDMSENNLT
ncbi:hypothetical protein ABQG65_03375 [Yersinia alsatica]|uniref:hypothetical protein n=1 Tax=Yersinia alsatica TaxID=2890317 RepID=UPI0032EB7B95